jgi:hypothetical protein
LSSTNDFLRLSAIASNTVLNTTLTAGWMQLSGPASVSFGDSNAFNTTVKFGTNGIYGLVFSANNGGVTNVNLTVVVNPAIGPAGGLLAWWKMDEAGGTTAFDFSGNGLNATASGATFVSGYLSNALNFNGTSDAATFSSPDTGQITVTAWARADGSGNSAFPRILDTPGYRLFFRFDNQGSNGFDFATYSTGNGDWFSGVNTVRTGSWYHVAATYDRSSFTNVPTLYVNGVQTPSTTITGPSGTQPSYGGTGYIGNKSGLSRAWKGVIDDLRIYNRLLTSAEIKTLASMPPANLAPTVSAGTNQLVVSPGSASLVGQAADDGKPTPPGNLSYTWTETSGPGSVTFGSAQSLNTSASFSVAGNYVLQLTVDDGQVQTAQAVTVTAISRPVMAARLLSGGIEFSWQNNGGNWLFQYQTNPAGVGLNTGWLTMTDAVSNPFVLPLRLDAGSVFYRMVLTN